MHQHDLSISQDDKYLRAVVLAEDSNNALHEYLSFQEDEVIPMTESSIKVVGVDWGQQASIADSSLAGLALVAGSAPFSASVHVKQGMVALGDQQGTIRIAKRSGSGASTHTISLQVCSPVCRGFATLPDRSVARDSSRVLLWLFLAEQAHQPGGCHVSFSCDGRRLCSVGVSDGALMVWELALCSESLSNLLYPAIF